MKMQLDNEVKKLAFPSYFPLSEKISRQIRDPITLKLTQKNAGSC